MSEFADFTTEEVIAILKLVSDDVQWRRETGENDLRSILSLLRGMRDDISKGAGIAVLTEKWTHKPDDEE